MSRSLVSLFSVLLLLLLVPAASAATLFLSESTGIGFGFGVTASDGFTTVGVTSASYSVPVAGTLETQIVGILDPRPAVDRFSISLGSFADSGMIGTTTIPFDLQISSVVWEFTANSVVPLSEGPLFQVPTAGTPVFSGTLQVGDEVVALPSFSSSILKSDIGCCEADYPGIELLADGSIVVRTQRVVPLKTSTLQSGTGMTASGLSFTITANPFTLDSATYVPEPSTGLLLGFGLFTIALGRRRNRL
jgi:hypothetical protein